MSREQINFLFLYIFQLVGYLISKKGKRFSFKHQEYIEEPSECILRPHGPHVLKAEILISDKYKYFRKERKCLCNVKKN